MKVVDLNREYNQLYAERSFWFSQWRELSKFILPYNGKYFHDDKMAQISRTNKIYDNAATRASKILSAGMMSGMTNPARPWFKISLEDKELADFGDVKTWLEDVTESVSSILRRSNVYRVLPSVYSEMGVFGGFAGLIDDDYNDVIRLHPFTAGEYMIGVDWTGRVDKLYREFNRTVHAVVKYFGYENVSKEIQQAYDAKEFNKEIVIRHAIYPRPVHERELGKIGNKNMPFASVYWEAGRDYILKESGFEEFPVVAPRWDVRPGDTYGNSPGMEVLGDIKQLQLDQFRKSQAIDYQANPPLQIPASMKNRESDLFPGGFTYYDETATGAGIRTAFEVNLDIRTLLDDINDIRERIRSSFYVDTFLAITSQTKQMTAYETAQRKAEQMVMLGPVVERTNNELLEPMINTVFQRLLKAGMLPPVPQELEGQDLKIEYISIMAQAQKSAAINSISAFVGELGQIAAIKPDVLDKFDSDKWVDIVSDMSGVPHDLILSDKNVSIIRQQRAEAMAQQQKQQTMLGAAEVANKVGNIPAGEGTPGEMIMDTLKQRMGQK